MSKSFYNDNNGFSQALSSKLGKIYTSTEVTLHTEASHIKVSWLMGSFPIGLPGRIHDARPVAVYDGIFPITVTG